MASISLTVISGAQLTRSQGCAEQVDHGIAPKLHQTVAIVVDASHPGTGATVQSSWSNHGVYMGIELQPPIEGVKNSNDANLQIISRTRPSFYGLGS
jgi:hypothetical protein